MPTIFHGGNLAYLALTGKIELQVRDQVALMLRTVIPPENLVAREWTRRKKSRCDLAIVHGGNPNCIVEFKAMYSFDPLIEGKTAMRLPRTLLTDCLERERDYRARTLGVLLVTHPLGRIPEEYGHGVTKYRDDINLAFSRYGPAGNILSGCESKVEHLFRKRDFTSRHGVLQAGNCFGTQVEIHYWLVETRKPPTKLGVPDSAILKDYFQIPLKDVE